MNSRKNILNCVYKSVSVTVKKAIPTPLGRDCLPDTCPTLQYPVTHKGGPAMEVGVQNGVFQVGMQIASANAKSLVQLSPILIAQTKKDYAFGCITARKKGTANCGVLVTIQHADSAVRKLVLGGELSHNGNYVGGTNWRDSYARNNVRTIGVTSDDLANEHFGKSIFYKDESLWVDDFVKLRKGELWTRAIQNTRPIHCWYKQHPRLGRKLFKHVRAMRRDDDLSAAQSTQFEKEINEASLRTWMKGSLDFIDDYQSVIGNFLQRADQVQRCIFSSTLMKLRNLSELTLEKTDRSIFTDIGRCKASVRVVATQDVRQLVAKLWRN
ncbi:MAG: hypothetical protein WA746_13800 [Isosphaeraceae bacterium]